MKRLLLILFLCSTCWAQWSGVKPPLGTQIQNWPQGLVGYWLLNEAGGNRVNDLSGNGNTGTVTGAAWVGGKFGPCLSFDGTGDYAESAFSFVPAPLTISAWVKLKSSAVEGYHEAITRGGLFTDDTNFALGVRYTALGKMMPYCYWHNRLTLCGSESAGDYFAIIANKSVCITATINASFGLCLYLNGLLIQTDSVNTAPTDGAQTLRIGSFTGSGSYDWNGLIETAQIFNRALTAAEVARLYHDPFWMFREERPELYVTAGAPPAGTQPGNIMESPVFHSPVIGASLGLGGLILICGCARRRSPKL
jgi:hypothetical protein